VATGTGTKLEWCLKTRFVPRSKHSQFRLQKPVMLCWPNVADCCQIYTNPTNVLCGQKVEFFNVRSNGTYNNHWSFKWSIGTTTQLRIWVPSCAHGNAVD